MKELINEYPHYLILSIGITIGSVITLIYTYAIIKKEKQKRKELIKNLDNNLFIE